jgi:hypothetical protein
MPRPTSTRGQNYPVDHHARWRAAGLYLRGRGAVSGRSAAAFWGADALVRGDPIEVTVPEEARIRPPAGLAVVGSPLADGDLMIFAGSTRSAPAAGPFSGSPPPTSTAIGAASWRWCGPR